MKVTAHVKKLEEELAWHLQYSVTLEIRRYFRGWARWGLLGFG